MRCRSASISKDQFQYSIGQKIFKRSVRCREHQLQFQNINFNIFLCSKGRCAAEDIADNIGLKLAYNALQHFRGQKDQKEKENCLPDLPFDANQLFWVNNRMIGQKIRLCDFSSLLQWTFVPSKTSQHIRVFSNLLW